jgi:signal transduction histidine kinase
MFKTLRAKLILSYAAIVGLFLLLALGGSVLIAQDLGKTGTYKSLHEKGAIIFPFVQFEINNSSRPAAQSILSKLREGITQSRVRVIVVNSDTMVVEDDSSNQSSLTGGTFKISDDVAPDLYTAAGAEGMFTQDRTRYLYVARAIRVSPAGARLLNGAQGLGDRLQPQAPGTGGPLAARARNYIVVVAQPLNLGELLSGLFNFVGRAAVVALLASLVLGLVLARSISNPISRLAEAAAAMARGDYSPRVSVAGHDEIATLSQRFNEMAEEVDRAHHMERDFVANVSHDLKTPLTSIQGFSQAMIDGSIVDQAGYTQAAEIINSEAERMSRLVTELLNLSRLQNGLNTIELAPTNLSALLGQLAVSMQPQAAQAAVELSLEAPAGEPLWVLADGDRLRQAFGNLVDNAIKYTPVGGSVTLAVHPGNPITVSITDTGHGIPNADLPRVMERFYQVDKSRSRIDGQSAGLGLAIAREIVRAHHGEITIASVAGNGTSVRVVLPPLPGSLQATPRTGVLKRLNGSTRSAQAAAPRSESESNAPPR